MKSLLRAATPVALALTIALTACGTAAQEGEDPSPDTAAGSQPTTSEPTTEPTRSPTPSPTRSEVNPVAPSPTESTPSAEPPADVRSMPPVQAAIQDLATRQEVAEESRIEVVSFHHVTWSDGSLGCPEPGRMYTQALVEGTRLILGLEGEQYSYHAGRDANLTYCADPQEPLRIDASS